MAWLFDIKLNLSISTNLMHGSGIHKSDLNLKRIFYIFLVLMLIGALKFSGDFISVYDRINLSKNYNYSSEIVHGIVLNEGLSNSNNNKCNINYSNIRVIESFKGKLHSGDVFKAIGITSHEHKNVGSEQFLLLKPFSAMEYPGYGRCNDEDYKDYLVIHNWCCSIDNVNERSFVMYNMLNSEQKGENFLIPVRATFLYFRAIKLLSY